MITAVMDKHKIESSFSKAAMRYDAHASLQKEVAEDLTNRLSAISHQLSAAKILDIGCGTGFLSHNLAERFPEADILGCDISHSMIKVASCKLQVTRCKKINLITADGEILPCKNETFDIATSNLTYQWLPDLDTAFSEAHRVLRPGGIFMFSTLGPETLKELRYSYTEASAKFNKDGLPPFVIFSEKQAVQSALESAGFKNISVEITKTIKTYPDMWTLLKTMKSIGAGNPFKQGDTSLGRGSLLKKMAEIYKERFKIQDSRLATRNPQPATRTYVYATYEVMFVHAEK